MRGQEFLDRRASQDQSVSCAKGNLSRGLNGSRPCYNDVVQVSNSGTELQVLTVGNYVYKNDNGTIKYQTGTLTTGGWSTVAWRGNTAHHIEQHRYGNRWQQRLHRCWIEWVSILITTARIDGCFNGSTTELSTRSGMQAGLSFARMELLSTTSPRLPAPLDRPHFPLRSSHPKQRQVCLVSVCGWQLMDLCQRVHQQYRSQRRGGLQDLQQNSTGTGLIVPLVAATLPGGEISYCLVRLRQLHHARDFSRLTLL